MKKEKSKVLIISYNFPPMGGGGVIRTLKFCKYLPRYNWTPVVLTVNEHDTDFVDYSLSKEIPETIVYSTFSIDLPLIYKRLNKGKKNNFYTHYDDIGSSELILTDWLKKAVDDFILIPDSRVGWIPFALRRALKICKNEKIDLIYSTGGPWTNHLIGLALKKITKMPWIADFRDAWTTNPFTLYPNKIRKTIEEKLEKYVLKLSDRIITVNLSIGRELKNKYKDIAKEKFVIIRNGFDKNDFDGVTPKNKSGFNILYTGNIYGKRTVKVFLFALKELLIEGKLSETSLNVNFVGTVDDKTKQIVDSLNLNNVVKYSSNVPHFKSIQFLAEADLLLLIVGIEKYECPGKAYEYLAAKKPILSLSGNGEISNILKEFNHVTIVSTNNLNEIKSAIYDLYKKYQSGDLIVNTNGELIRRFDRKELTNQLASIFNQLV